MLLHKYIAKLNVVRINVYTKNRSLFSLSPHMKKHRPWIYSNIVYPNWNCLVVNALVIDILQYLSLWILRHCVQRINGNYLSFQIISFTFLSFDHNHDWSEILIAFLCHTDSKKPEKFIWNKIINKAEWKQTNCTEIVFILFVNFNSKVFYFELEWIKWKYIQLQRRIV